MAVALLALVIATAGTAVAATKLVSGDGLIQPASLSGNRLRNHTLTGGQINLNKLGTVPLAKQAASARRAAGGGGSGEGRSHGGGTGGSVGGGCGRISSGRRD